jgi:predicted DNA-binding protein
MASCQFRNLHVPLPDHVHGRLKLRARTAGRPATTLAREAIEEWLRRREQETLDAEIGRYATAHAGTAADLDRDLEAAAVDLLAKEERRSSPRPRPKPEARR